MAIDTAGTPPPHAPGRVRAPHWIVDHPVLAFVGTTYLLSWSLWLTAWVLAERFDAPAWASAVPVVVGGLGPPIAALMVLRWTGTPTGPWWRSVARWRVPARYYAYALGLPALLYAFANGVLVVLGEPVTVGLLGQRWPAYLATFAFTLTIGGALEEPGWRGFALPRLQERFGPLRATALLGLAWGVWHVALYGPLGFVVPFVLAFFYTWLYNRTGSVLLCILLHASFTPAQDHLLLLRGDVHGTTDLAVGLAYLLGAAVIVLATRGQLGLVEEPSD